jgi:hypothetical protein
MQVRSVRAYLHWVRAARRTALGSSLSVHQRFDGALEVSNVSLARVAETRAFVVVIVLTVSGGVVCLLKEHRHWPLENQARGGGVCVWWGGLLRAQYIFFLKYLIVCVCVFLLLQYLCVYYCRPVFQK